MEANVSQQIGTTETCWCVLFSSEIVCLAGLKSKRQCTVVCVLST